MKAIVVGGGIGGLAAAIALQRAGLEVVVFERAEELREIGAGVALWANATKALRKLGVYEAVRAAGAEIGGEARSWRGRKLFSLPADGLRRRFGSPNLVVHRADLQAALLSALPRGTVRLGAELVGFGQDGKGVTARFADGREEAGDLLVGADGIRSAVRARLLGDGEPLFSGLTAWRGISEVGEDVAPPGVGLNLWGRGAEFGLASIGGGRAYWYFSRNAPEGALESPAGRKREVLEHLRGWYGPAREAVEATGESKILRTDLYDREPAKRWGEGRVTLLGDAAHPMTPHLGQGACQAIEDAVVLADGLRGVESVATGLRSYEDRRIGRTGDIVRRSRRVGQVMQVESPLLCWLRDALVGITPASVRLRQLDPAVGYEV